MLHYWNVQDSISQRLGARGVFGIVVFFWRHTRIILNITVLEGVLGGSGMDPLIIIPLVLDVGVWLTARSDHLTTAPIKWEVG
jgi:hypothetical protein